MILFVRQKSIIYIKSKVYDLYFIKLFSVTTVDKLLSAGRITTYSDNSKLSQLFSMLDRFDPMFNIITPLGG